MAMSFSGMILGQGAFGRVVKAEAIGIVDYVDVLSVAVKMVKGIGSYSLSKSKSVYN